MATDTATANRERTMRMLEAMPPYPDAAIPAPYTATVPLRVEPRTGRVRVGDTRIPIDTVLYHHKRGVSPRTIVRELPTLALPDVFAVIAYYYQHQEEVDAYLQAWKEPRGQGVGGRSGRGRRFHGAHTRPRQGDGVAIGVTRPHRDPFVA